MSSYLLLQCLILVVYIWCDIQALSLDAKSSPKIVKRSIENPWLYYTYWNLVMQHIFLAHGILHEIFLKMYPTKESVLRVSDFVKNFFFVNVIFPMTTVVAVLFWTFYLIDRELIYPKLIDDYIPHLLNYISHLFIVVPVALEFFTKTIKLAPTNLTVLTFAVELVYTSIFVHHYVTHDEWIYPVFYFVGWPLKILIILSITFGKIACLFTLHWCKSNSKIFGKEKSC